MKERYSNMNLLEFQEKFKTEEDCRKKLFALRWPDGFECPKCKEKQCYELTDRPLYQCQNCRYQVSVTAGTVMHRTRTPLLKWFWAIFLVSTDKRGISALALSKKIGVSYWVAWTMLQKLRQGMRDRDSNYKLAGVIEMDDAFFGGPQQGGDKRGRGTSKIPVIVEVSTKGKGVGFARMTVVDHVDRKTICKIVRTDIKENQRIKTDGFRAYNVVKEEGHNHQREIVKNIDIDKVLKWSHILVSNAKAFILGTFHGVNKKHLQRYLDEFCYRFNRRWAENQLFDRLLTACITSQSIAYAELTQ